MVEGTKIINNVEVSALRRSALSEYTYHGSPDMMTT